MVLLFGMVDPAPTSSNSTAISTGPSLFSRMRTTLSQNSSQMLARSGITSVDAAGEQNSTGSTSPTTNPPTTTFTPPIRATAVASKPNTVNAFTPSSALVPPTTAKQEDSSQLTPRTPLSNPSNSGSALVSDSLAGSTVGAPTVPPLSFANPVQPTKPLASVATSQVPKLETPVDVTVPIASFAGPSTPVDDPALSAANNVAPNLVADQPSATQFSDQSSVSSLDNTPPTPVLPSTPTSSDSSSVLDQMPSFSSAPSVSPVLVEPPQPVTPSVADPSAGQPQDNTLSVAQSTFSDPAQFEQTQPPEPPQELPITSDTQPASVLDQAVSLAVQQSDTLNPAVPARPGAKEQSQVFTLEHPAVDQPAGMQSVEQLRNPEIPVEVESFLQKVEDHQEQLPKEVVVADATVTQPTNHYLAQPVIVLPITPEIEKAGAHKGTKFSVRWLVEWSWKIMKVFSGKVVYRQTEA